VKVEFRRSFEKDIGKIRDADLLERIKLTIEEVEATESLLDLSNVKKLNADGDLYRIRVGDYRIGLACEDDIVIFIRFLHRREMYRYFP
jgi:mRNA interferase RelE/StbE